MCPATPACLEKFPDDIAGKADIQPSRPQQHSQTKRGSSASQRAQGKWGGSRSSKGGSRIMKRVLLAILAGRICSAQTPPQVKVEGGLLQGTSENGLSVYRGIPFAAPPSFSTMR